MTLDYNTRVTTPATDLTAGEFGKGISIPEELYETAVRAGGLDFTLGNPGENNALICRGQKIHLPAGTAKVAILAASADGDVTATFNNTSVKVRDFSEDIGGWYSIACGDQAFMKPDAVAISYSHTHDRDGDRLYKFANIFKYLADTNGAEEITLPDDERIVVMAITALPDHTANTRPSAALIDTVPETDEPIYTLTAENVQYAGQFRLHEGDLIRVRAMRCNENGVFTGFGGNANIIWQDDVQALVRMGKKDAEIHPIYSDLGENVALNKPCKAHTYRFEHETPDVALNGNSYGKWAGEVDDNHEGWLEVDLGEVTPIHKYLAFHCGEYEDHCDSTTEYRLEYRVSEEDDWTVIHDVKDNHDYLTIYEFAPVNARYVRLFITRPTPHSDRTCRIYQFHIYKYNAE